MAGNLLQSKTHEGVCLQNKRSLTGCCMVHVCYRKNPHRTNWQTGGVGLVLVGGIVGTYECVSVCNYVSMYMLFLCICSCRYICLYVKYMYVTICSATICYVMLRHAGDAMLRHARLRNEMKCNCKCSSAVQCSARMAVFILPHQNSGRPPPGRCFVGGSVEPKEVSPAPRLRGIGLAGGFRV